MSKRYNTVYIMSNNTPDQAFWQRVDALIHMVNDQCDQADPNTVAASTLFAAARFNAFIVARTTGSPEAMASEKERALDYFVDQFRKMLEDNYEDFSRNFDKYMVPAQR